MTPPDLEPVALALGRLPTGLYLVTTLTEGGPVGFVGSFVMQVGLEPPAVCVAIGRGRGQLTAVRATGHFGLSILDAASQGLMNRFFRKYGPGQGPFDGLELGAGPAGTPYLKEALAWLECHVQGEHETADHVVVFGEVTAGERLREGDPSIHLRKNGLSY
jgi:flavin reductase (DIM6/NTAB) family NADH-FMN oxidoreductase RutF